MIKNRGIYQGQLGSSSSGRGTIVNIQTTIQAEDLVIIVKSQKRGEEIEEARAYFAEEVNGEWKAQEEIELDTKEGHGEAVKEMLDIIEMSECIEDFIVPGTVFCTIEIPKK